MIKLGLKCENDNTIWTEYNIDKDTTMLQVSQTISYLEIIKQKLLKVAIDNSNKKGDWNE